MDGLVRVFNLGAECMKADGVRRIRVPNTKITRKTLDSCVGIMKKNYPGTVSGYEAKGDKIEIALNMDVLETTKLSAFADQLKTATAGIKYSSPERPVWRQLPRLAANAK